MASTGHQINHQGLSVSCVRWGEMAEWLEREFTDRKVRGSNPISASRLPLSWLGLPVSIPALVLPSGGMAARHQKGVTAERSQWLLAGTTMSRLRNRSTTIKLED
ncbi:hypothetical protein T265_06340 [Opisthorchis viverrini]|uniref:Uncharacterized protein n=1 Tax=Opisthorchis viverrini TaxID=6198 RepID=A0A074ZSS0_OPIVI|nr:hypothetical protein T265_06340 [Opisthorchis viverrini]KER26425.1 hypothetical protein T265_06340 [Opisthorchis viverrini]